MKQHAVRSAAGRPWRARALSLLLAAVMVLGLVPGLDLSVTGSAHWADAYLDQMVEWGFMSPSQTEDPNRALTRAEFMAIVNRAYGYNVKGAIPFTDVKEEDWFYDDVSIAYTAKYINGTSATTASPHSTLTRETATTILGRNMMLQESPGELIDFSDGRGVSNWAMGMVKAAVENYLIDGYTDGTFQPKRSVTRAEMAALMTRTVGTPLQEAGEYALDGVFGNVTITSPGVTLKDTVISGDLYVTGGVGLGDVRLENVTVLGRIIAAGTGVGEKGDVSILMRNVTADELLVDNLQDQYVSLRTDGVTQIGKVTVATSAYLEDNTPQGSGMKLITFEGDANSQLDLAGRIEEVVTKTPNATVRLAKGTIEKMTVDEAAPGSRVIIDQGAEIKELNLDVGTAVSGEGDIGTLNVNAPGSTVTMLPDQINIRPGITATIHGQVMDAAAAAEASRDPKILAGYPVANDVAPTTFNARFMTNKQGTVYWAVSALSDGSIEAEELINPSSYGSAAVQKGSVAAPAADKLVASKVSSLQPGGSYYLSAVMVDSRGDRSPVKVIAFETPDNTKPAFVTGYPYMSRLTDTAAQVTVMPNKSCKMYYIVLPRGASAPTADQLKANSITGNLGYGVLDVEQNVEIPVDVSNRLEELKSYDLYLWLTDADGANSSNVQKISFTTVDRTPPEFLVDPAPNKVAETSVGLTFRLNEAGTVYWALVKEGEEYPKRKAGESEVDLSSDYAKLQVSSGMNALKSGSVSAAENKDGSINVTGLEQEGAYDLWYVAQDKAGNYSARVEKVTIHTLDNKPPVVKQYFTRYNGQDNTQNPMPSTDIVLEFSEGVRSNVKGGDDTSFADLYAAIEQAGEGKQAELKEKMAEALRQTIELHEVTEVATPKVKERTKNSDPADTDWVIDYRNAVITSREGKLLVTFPSEGSDSEKALNLASGATYFFRLTDIADTSTNRNVIEPNPLDYDAIKNIATEHVLPRFTTVFAQVNLRPLQLGGEDVPQKNGKAVEADFRFQMIPQTTSKVPDNMSFDLLLWSDTTIRYDLYYRVVDEKGTPLAASEYIKFPNADATVLESLKEANGWVYLGNSGLSSPTNNNLAGKSTVSDFLGINERSLVTSANFPKLNLLDDSEKVFYQFVASMTQMGSLTERDQWSGEVNLTVYAAAGTSGSLENLSSGLSMDRWGRFTASGLNGDNGGASIGNDGTGKDFIVLNKSIADTALPEFTPLSPTFDAGDTFVTMNLNLNRAGTIYYVIAEKNGIVTAVKNGETEIRDNKTDNKAGTEDTLWNIVPKDGTDTAAIEALGTVVSPSNLDIKEPPYNNNPGVLPPGTVNHSGGQGLVAELVTGLKPLTQYYVYFVIQGAYTDPSEIQLYKFETTNISKPKITLNRPEGAIVQVKTHVNANLDYIMFTREQLMANDTLSTATIKDYMGSFVDENNQALTVPARYQNMTIIEAMMETYTYAKAQDAIKDNGETGSEPFYTPGPNQEMDDYSVFDIYANDSIKEQVADLIRSGSGTSDNSCSGSNAPRANKWETVDRTKDLKKDTYYYFLAVARHESSTSSTGDAFKAVRNVRVMNTATPVPQESACRASINGNENGLYGYIMIAFDQPLYWMGRGQEDQPKTVYNTADASGAPEDTSEDWIGILDDMVGSAKSKLEIKDADEAKYANTTFTINFDEVQPGDSFTFFNSGMVSNSSGSTDSQNKLTVDFLENVTTSSLPNNVTRTTTTWTINLSWGSTGSSKVIYTYSYSKNVDTVLQPTNPGGGSGGSSGNGTQTTSTTPSGNTGQNTQSGNSQSGQPSTLPNGVVINPIKK